MRLTKMFLSQTKAFESGLVVSLRSIVGSLASLVQPQAGRQQGRASLVSEMTWNEERRGECSLTRGGDMLVEAIGVEPGR